MLLPICSTIFQFYEDLLALMRFSTTVLSVKIAYNSYL